MTSRPAKFKTEPLPIPDINEGWINVVITYDGQQKQFFVNGELLPRARVEQILGTNIGVIIDENVPEFQFYAFEANSVTLSDDIAEIAGGIWDTNVTPSAAKLNYKLKGSDDIVTFSGLSRVEKLTPPPPPDSPLRFTAAADTDGNVLDWSKVNEKVKELWRKEKWHVNYNDHNSNLATAENLLESWKNMTIEEQRKKAYELINNTFIKPELLKKHYNIDIEALLQKSEMHNEQPKEFYKHLNKNTWTIDLDLIPDEPEGQSLNMWLRSLVTDDKH